MNASTDALHVDSHSLIQATFSLQWISPLARHTDQYHFPNLNVWRDLDLLPQELQSEILGRPRGYTGGGSFEPGQLVANWTESRLLRIKDRQFDRHWRRQMQVEPRLGRFYPQGMLQEVPSVYRSDLNPARLVALDADRLTFDLNHPLARYEAEISVAVGDIRPAGDERGGRCEDVLHEVMRGPGMQVRASPEQATDFLADNPFQRIDESADAYFYAMPRMVNHLDLAAQGQVQTLYGKLLKSGMKILDLMSSINSHLPDSLFPAQVTGLGMNREELDANPILQERLVHDLNQTPQLPSADAVFDAVICTLSVEYLTRPFTVFREVARVLRPGGIFVLTFSNRWFPPKAIGLWHNLHEFERPGLVLEYFLESGAYRQLETFSLRGLPRPEDDLHIGASLVSDPLYAVWGIKR